MTRLDRYDIAIAGGGLAGLCLALQLRKIRPEASILVIERNSHPLPEAAHKVGESAVEVGSHYFEEVLGLHDVLDGELRKFGLRFFFSHDGNRDISSRLEVGPSHYLTVPSFQIDRGRFENKLARKATAAGIDFVDSSDVLEIALGTGGEDHSVCISTSGERFDVQCRWIVDASGRSSLLKKQLQLSLPNRHDVNAVWFRIDHEIDPDTWSDDLAWQARNKHPRRLSTNHLMGEGYWVWLIPLAGGRTSIGIVSEERRHPFAELRTFDSSLTWLERHEPQCAAAVRSQLNKRMDFLAIKNYSYAAKQVFSRDRWCLIGDAGFFIDPLYSPGSDFIGIANSFCCDLIHRDLDDENIGDIVAIYDQSYRSLARTFLLTTHRQYPIMGCGRVMAAKIVWDFVMYWGGIALLFFRKKLSDPEFMDRARPILMGFAQANIRMQALFREWADTDQHDVRPGTFVDYAEIPFLADLNRNLLQECDDDALFVQIEGNLELARELLQEMRVAAGRADAAPTSHLSEMFAAI